MAHHIQPREAILIEDLGDEQYQKTQYHFTLAYLFKRYYKKGNQSTSFLPPPRDDIRRFSLALEDKVRDLFMHTTKVWYIYLPNPGPDRAAILKTQYKVTSFPCRGIYLLAVEPKD